MEKTRDMAQSGIPRNPIVYVIGRNTKRAISRPGRATMKIQKAGKTQLAKLSGSAQRVRKTNGKNPRYGPKRFSKKPHSVCYWPKHKKGHISARSSDYGNPKSRLDSARKT